MDNSTLKKTRWASSNTVIDQSRPKKKQKHENKKDNINNKKASEIITIEDEQPPLILDREFEEKYIINLPSGSFKPCGSISRYERLNFIEEGTYGIVTRAKDKITGDIIALKKLKVNRHSSEFCISSLREIAALLRFKHKNIVNLREIVIGNKPSDVYIVMDFIQHDLRSLIAEMSTPFLASEIKALMYQLLSGVAEIHSCSFVHRDLKTSNLLLTNDGYLKIADFGLSRFMSKHEVNKTSLVVSLWYRAPELLLNEYQNKNQQTDYSSAIDMWSVGCIFAELITKKPLFSGTNELDQLSKIFDKLGIPSDLHWKNYSETFDSRLVNQTFLKHGHNHDNAILRLVSDTISSSLSDGTKNLLDRLLTMDPSKRITAKEALKHWYFQEEPRAKDPSLFPSFPSKGALER